MSAESLVYFVATKNHRWDGMSVVPRVVRANALGVLLEELAGFFGAEGVEDRA